MNVVSFQAKTMWKKSEHLAHQLLSQPGNLVFFTFHFPKELIGREMVPLPVLISDLKTYSGTVAMLIH